MELPEKYPQETVGPTREGRPKLPATGGEGRGLGWQGEHKVKCR